MRSLAICFHVASSSLTRAANADALIDDGIVPSGSRMGARSGEAEIATISALSRDRGPVRFDVRNDFNATKRLRCGSWYGDDESAAGGHSCRHLRDCFTEFGAQGLELDPALLAWGTDFLWADGGWRTDRSRGYRRGGPAVRDPWQLRANAYRVLLTRARDATVVFVPPLPELDAMYACLRACGFRPLTQT